MVSIYRTNKLYVGEPMALDVQVAGNDGLKYAAMAGTHAKCQFAAQPAP